MAQLAEWSLLISEDPGLDRVIDILLYTVEKLQIKKKSIFWYFYNWGRIEEELASTKLENVTALNVNQSIKSYLVVFPSLQGNQERFEDKK